MKVITVKQPFATLIAERLKRYEFRTWKTNYRGEILIHAGKSIDKVAMKRYEKLNLDYPLGCILAKVKITDCIEVDELFKEQLKKENSLVYYGVINDDKFKGYGFKLKDVSKVDHIYVNGKLGLWNFDYKK